jgi:hypothetical protein
MELPKRERKCDMEDVQMDRPASVFELGNEFEAMRHLRGTAARIGRDVELTAAEWHYSTAHHALDADILEMLGCRLCDVARAYGTFAGHCEGVL